MILKYFYKGCQLPHYGNPRRACSGLPKIENFSKKFSRFNQRFLRFYARPAHLCPPQERAKRVNGGIFDSEGCCFFQSGPSSRGHGGRFSEIVEINIFLIPDQTVSLGKKCLFYQIESYLLPKKRDQKKFFCQPVPEIYSKNLYFEPFWGLTSHS